MTAPIPIVGNCTNSGNTCPPIASTGLCLADGTPIMVVVQSDCVTGVITENGWVDLLTGIYTPGNPPLGTAPCTTGSGYDFELSGWLCDVIADGTIVGVAAVQIERDSTGAIIGVTLIGIDGLPYVPVGTMQLCPASVDDEWEVLCDDIGPFLRRLRTNPNLSTTVTDFVLDGITPYITSGTVVTCNTGCANTTIVLELCDQQPPPDAGSGLQIPFLRTIVTDCLGATLSATDTDLNGNPYAVTGTVVRCSYVTGPDGGTLPVALTNQVDPEFEILCDLGAANTPFLRRYNSDNLGVVTSTTDTTLDGLTPYVAVGPILDECPCTAEVPFTIEPHHSVLSGVATFTTPAAGCISVSVLIRNVGAVGSVTVTTADGPFDALDNETFTWSVVREQDQELDPVTVDTTNAADEVLVIYTVAV